MTDSILDAMTEQYNSMTRSGKKLANYILSNTAETQYLSITSLAENSGMTTSATLYVSYTVRVSIIRHSQNLSFRSNTLLSDGN